ncbi:hypothetical protein MCHIJ_07950 [Mycolicibacterium chitae]|uniref:Mce associated membrane protein n=1 Tax=Mycolicibacterium chitae TaxID=1792 RepID=A0A448ICK8_MYCCI|nr:mammalian cell entry protein [Mycolicibacterium chitae]MCV7104379.1 mammalian cell entry protein [Mycolicibacterium chitae]BBZ01358.1 hypothetical protein MCHIJ_07950 [Mycolicibacterium chitae]VEG50195.1 mce associated membrane protein [Mycolicibacterium chitae]
MEDQRPGSGDLSDESPRVPQGKRQRAAAAPAEETVPETETETETAPDPDEPVVLVERRPPGRRAGIVIGIAAALFVAAGGFAGAMAQPYIAERATVHTKLQIARTAADAITTLWTYTPDNMDQLANRSARYLAGDFQAEYRKYIDAIVPTNKQAQVTNSTEVVGAAVESLDGSEATAIVYTNSTSTSPLSKNIPSMKYISYRLTLQRDSGQWLVNGMTSITNLDLTPQI